MSVVQELELLHELQGKPCVGQLHGAAPTPYSCGACFHVSVAVAAQPAWNSDGEAVVKAVEHSCAGLALLQLDYLILTLVTVVVLAVPRV